MVIIIGRLTMNSDIMEAYEQDLANMIPKVITEDGCRYYSLLVEDKSAGVVAVTEIWDDEAALLKHFGQPWILKFMGKYGDHIVGSTLRVFDGENERGLPGS